MQATREAWPGPLRDDASAGLADRGGGWAFENELQMLKANPDLLGLPTLVWVSNTGDFGAGNGWTNPVNYPDHKPISALLYLARKTVLKPHDVVDSPRSAAATAKWQADLRTFLAAYHGRLIWVLYPKKSEVGRPMPEFAPLLSTLGGRAKIVDVSRSAAWRSSFYRDGIHPNPVGDRVLASVIAAAL